MVRISYFQDMSTDTAKDNASVVDSSITQKLDVGYADDAENSSYRANGDAQQPSAERREHYENSVKNICAVNNAKKITRYFVIKSLSHHNIQLSVQKGIWATQVMNEPILDEAFHNSDKVILIFSVNMSGFFQGYAQMMSSVGWRRDDVWSQGTGGSNPWGRSFKVKWLRLNNLPFHKSLHLKNPLNDYKPVKISRDCQELTPDIGESLCELIDKEIDDGEKGVRDDTHLRWHGMEPACSVQNDDYNVPPTNTNLGGRSMLYPTLLQQQIAEASRSHASYQGSVGVFYPGCLPFMTSKPAHSRYSLPGQKIEDAEDPHTSSHLDGWGLSSDADPFYNNYAISEDEFLEMSYEEYLEAHSGSNKRRNNPAVSPSRGKQANKEDNEDVERLTFSPSGAFLALGRSKT
ncbi:hypothetical protein V2J09_004828 [Rumex salicifolius]